MPPGSGGCYKAPQPRANLKRLVAWSLHETQKIPSNKPGSHRLRAPGRQWLNLIYHCIVFRACTEEGFNGASLDDVMDSIDYPQLILPWKECDRLR